MIYEVEAKSLLAPVKKPDKWFGLKYNMNLYRGCPHQCIYCDSRSECYQIDNYRDVLVKVNAPELLQRELPAKRVKGVIGFGSMSDTYSPVEFQYDLTGRALQIIAEYGFPVHIITKSDLIVKDLEVLSRINRVRALVSFTITTADDDLARKIEPGAPLPSRRFKAMNRLSQAGIVTGVTLMPMLPFITDNSANVTAIIDHARRHGAKYIIPAFGMTLRDRQRMYYYQELERIFPGLREKYQSKFKDAYFCNAEHADRLKQFFIRHCETAGIKTGIQPFLPHFGPEQMYLF